MVVCVLSHFSQVQLCTWEVCLSLTGSLFCLSSLVYLYFSLNRNSLQLNYLCKTTQLLFLFSHSVVSNSLQPHGLQHSRLPCPSLSHSLLTFMSFESMMPSKHFILCHPLLLLSSIFLIIRIFSYELALHISLPNYWSFRFSISPSNEY